jgi:hypothetical protein
MTQKDLFLFLGGINGKKGLKSIFNSKRGGKKNKNREKI